MAPCAEACCSTLTGSSPCSIHVQRDAAKTHISSLLKQKYPMIIPGDRFRETYYWDAFWILKGLLASGMHQSAIALTKNFIGLVFEHGFVPNGCRV